MNLEVLFKRSHEIIHTAAFQFYKIQRKQVRNSPTVLLRSVLPLGKRAVTMQGLRGASGVTVRIYFMIEILAA